MPNFRWYGMLLPNRNFLINGWRLNPGQQEQKGREIYYSLEIDKMKEIDKWLEQFRKIWETRFNQLDNLLSTIKKNKK